MFGAQASSSPFGTPSSTPAFGTPSSTPAFGTGFGSTLFSTPFSQPQQQQQQTSLFQTPQSSGGPFSFSTLTQQPQSTPFGQPNAFPFPNPQLTTQMAPVAPLPFSLADRDIQAIVDAYKEETGSTKYAFKHLLCSVTEPQYRTKPAGVSDIMWAEAMCKLEGMESTDRERLWPQLVQGFKDLSERLKLRPSLRNPFDASASGRWNLCDPTKPKPRVYLKVTGHPHLLQDKVIVSDAERLQMTQSNVKMLQRHFQADTLPWIERMRHKEQGFQRRLLRVMRILEALEGKGCRLPLMKGEADLVEKLAAITRQLKGSGAELFRRVQNLLTICRVQNGLGGGSVYLPGSTKIHEQSLADMQEVLQQQTDAIARLGNVLKRDIRDVEIIMAEETEMIEG
ncbi:hypothetical protein RND71_026407 [Anisodus tanguticus]|uniref:Nucleoporin Nup54 alpha-helical domain-containing protein n=1 Tax=Anisodus tanguticus TaxID=243964 RepID=A0AAE1RNU4_9SOLA|nr:hypothetical protein RND71_026407 [Anisodus tanguticus]